MKNEMICFICLKKIESSDYFKGFGYIHHRTCHERVYGVEFDD